jgi:hypothetical protein
MRRNARRSPLKEYLLFLTIGVLLLSPPVWAGRPRNAERVGAEVAVAWFDLLYDVVRAEKLSPPVAARVYGIAGITLYDAVVPGARRHRSLIGQLNGLPSLPRPRRGKAYHWPTVANSALAAVTRQLLPEASASSLAAIETLEQRVVSQFEPTLSWRRFTRSVTQGQEIAEAVADWAATDGYDTVNNCPFTPPAGPGLWVPTPPAFAPAPLQPCWGHLDPFVLTHGAECAPPAPPPYSEEQSSEFFHDAQEVYDAGNALTPEQQTIAQYWADGAGATGTPAGHWVAIVGQIVEANQVSLMGAAEAYARVGIAVSDAFIASWYTKYQYPLLRPVTYIRAVIDPSWSPLLVTPPFPEYTSGHAVQSAAAATVLTAQFGERAFTDTTHAEHGLVPALAPRTFLSFQAAAAEAAISRLYGGIHFRPAIERGIAQGVCVGQQVLERLHFQK